MYKLSYKLTCVTCVCFVKKLQGHHILQPPQQMGLCSVSHHFGRELSFGATYPSAGGMLAKILLALAHIQICYL